MISVLLKNVERKRGRSPFRWGAAYLGHCYLEIRAGGGIVPLYPEPRKNVHHPWLRRQELFRQRDHKIVLVARDV